MKKSLDTVQNLAQALENACVFGVSESNNYFAGYFYYYAEIGI